MAVSFTGFLTPRDEPETSIPSRNRAIDRDFVQRAARVHEDAGFDRVLIAVSAKSPDVNLLAAYAAAATERLGFMLAHRTGFVAPPVAARAFATLDQLTGGRVSLHAISGGRSAEQQSDGDFLEKDERYARTDEFLEIVKKVWTSDSPFDYAGRHYQVKGAFSEIKPVQTPAIPIYFGGASDAAIPIGGKHADVFALYGEPLDQARDLTTRVRNVAAEHGRQVRFSISLRPIIADTEAAAWKRAEDILERIKAVRVAQGLPLVNTQRLESVGRQSLIDAAATSAVHDRRLWMAPAGIAGAVGSNSSLVGTTEQVADSLLDYYDIGITTFLLRGFDLLDDAAQFGRELIPLVQQRVVEREAQLRAKRA